MKECKRVECMGSNGCIDKCWKPQRTWVGLTDDDILLISADCAATHQHTDIHFARAIEAKLRSKNHEI